jgi:type II secretory pathway pseudopilin PulG
MGILTNKTRRPLEPDSLLQVAKSEDGLTLVETLIAVLILSFGLLAAGQLIYAALGSASLARSKASAAIQAQNKLEYLADLYRQNPSASDLTAGSHGPQQVQVRNPVDGTTLNRYNVSWTVGMVPDPRVGKVIPAKNATVTITPIDAGSNTNNRVFLNKVVSVAAIFSAATQ